MEFSLEGYWKKPNEKVTFFFGWNLYVLETFSIVKKVVLNYLRETYFCLPRILFLYLFHDSLNFFNPYCTILPWSPGDVFFILLWQALPVLMDLYTCSCIFWRDVKEFMTVLSQNPEHPGWLNQPEILPIWLVERYYSPKKWVKNANIQGCIPRFLAILFATFHEHLLIQNSNNPRVQRNRDF